MVKFFSQPAPGLIKGSRNGMQLLCHCAAETCQDGFNTLNCYTWLPYLITSTAFGALCAAGVEGHPLGVGPAAYQLLLWSAMIQLLGAYKLFTSCLHSSRTQMHLSSLIWKNLLHPPGSFLSCSGASGTFILKYSFFLISIIKCSNKHLFRHEMTYLKLFTSLCSIRHLGKILLSGKQTLQTLRLAIVCTLHILRHSAKCEQKSVCMCAQVSWFVTGSAPIMFPCGIFRVAQHDRSWWQQRWTDGQAC